MFKHLVFLLTIHFIAAPAALGLEPVSVVLTSNAFQYIPLSIAQDRGYMKEEGIDLKFVYMQNAPGMQALLTGAVQFTGSGSSALVAPKATRRSKPFSP